MKYAWIQDDRIRDLTPSDPFNWHHPEVAKFYDTEVPDEAENGDFWENGKLIKPVIPDPVPLPPPPRKWSVDDVRSGLTLAEKVKWDNESVDVIKTAKIEFQTPQLVDKTTEILQFLVDSSALSQQTMENILS